MAAVIPFNSMDAAIAALAKIDVMHRHMAGSEGKVSDEYFLSPLQINVVSQGDDVLWDGASKFVNSETLRFRVGDSVKCNLQGEGPVGGVVVRQPVQDGEVAAYDVLLADGRRIILNDDVDEVITAGEPRAVSSFELVFIGGKVRKAHDEAVAMMGNFGRDVQLVDNMGPPEVVGRMVAQLKDPKSTQVDDALYEKTIENAASLLGTAVPADWKERRTALMSEYWPAQKKRPRGRPPAGGPKEPSFFCPAPGCNKAYASYGGLYLHKRAYHPEMINVNSRGRGGKGGGGAAAGRGRGGGGSGEPANAAAAAFTTAAVPESGAASSASGTGPSASTAPDPVRHDVDVLAAQATAAAAAAPAPTAAVAVAAAAAVDIDGDEAEDGSVPKRQRAQEGVALSGSNGLWPLE